jgi:hypothetical protein
MLTSFRGGISLPSRGGKKRNQHHSSVPFLHTHREMPPVSLHAMLIHPNRTWEKITVTGESDPDETNEISLEDGALIKILGKGFEEFWGGISNRFQIYMEDQRPLEPRRKHPKLADFAQQVLERLGMDCWNDKIEWIGDVLVFGGDNGFNGLTPEEYNEIDVACSKLNAEIARPDPFVSKSDASESEALVPVSKKKKEVSEEEEEPKSAFSDDDSGNPSDEEHSAGDDQGF